MFFDLFVLIFKIAIDIFAFIGLWGTISELVFEKKLLIPAVHQLLTAYR
jgi:hypothetical protein